MKMCLCGTRQDYHFNYTGKCFNLTCTCTKFHPVETPREKITEQEFIQAKREKQIAAAFPNGFRRYRVKNYERGEFRAK